MKKIIEQVEAELKRAREKFPSNKQLLHAFTEEAGEVTKAFLDLQQGKCTRKDVEKELIQSIVVAIRLLEEGDPEFPQFNFKEWIHQICPKCNCVENVSEEEIFAATGIISNMIVIDHTCKYCNHEWTIEIPLLESIKKAQ